MDRLLSEQLAAELDGVPAAELAGLRSALGVVERAVGALEARAGALHPGDLEMDLDEGAEPPRARKQGPARRRRRSAGTAGARRKLPSRQ